MNELLTDQKTVKATTDAAGRVWYLDGCGLPVPALVGSPWEFLRGRCFPPETRWRVPGLARNAGLLSVLYAAVKAGEFTSLEVCSPLCCFSMEQRNDPEVLLYNARAFCVSASVGGWRDFGEHDAAAYLLALAAAAGAAVPFATLAAHPAWPALAFVDGLCEASVAKLLGLVIDPRWYVDPASPDQSNKLSQFLGLDPRTQTAASLPVRAKQPERADRNRTVLACWKTVAAPHPSSLSPGQFLWKTWYAKGGGVKGDLAAGKKFVEYLRLTWLSAVAGDGHRGRLFVPKFFFDDEASAEAWRTHNAAR